MSRPISRAEMKDEVNEIWQKCLEEPVGMKYKDIKDFYERCDKHPDHQSGMISYRMVERRLQEEIEELREYIEQRKWVGLTADEVKDFQVNKFVGPNIIRAIERRLKEKNA